MSSFERLSSRLASLAKSTSGESRRSTSRESRTSSSLTYADSGSDDEYLYDDDLEKGGSRSRRRSMASMPGSLDDLHFEIDDNAAGEEYSDIEGGGPYEEGEVDVYDAEVGGEEGGVEEEAFDEDFLATTQMKKVPFL
jgi:phosphatidate phosphatase LPIN